MTTIITSHYNMRFGYAKLLAIPRRDVFYRSRAQRSSSRSHGRVRIVGAVTTTMYLYDGLRSNYLTAMAICVLFYRMYILLYCRQKPSRRSLLLLPVGGSIVRVVRSNSSRYQLPSGIIAITIILLE